MIITTLHHELTNLHDRYITVDRLRSHEATAGPISWTCQMWHVAYPGFPCWQTWSYRVVLLRLVEECRREVVQ